MKKIFFYLLSTALAAILFTTCKKTDLSPANQPPVANAGADATVIMPADSTTLNGSSSGDPDGRISQYQWTKISGPDSLVIVNPTEVKTKIRHLLTGTYRFQLQVTDSLGSSDRDTIQIKVSGPGPTANAGADTSITLLSCADYTGIAELNGTATADSYSKIVSNCWEMISGPGGDIINPCSAKTRVENMTSGEYVFQWTVTDAAGVVSRDMVFIHANGLKQYDFDATFSSSYSFIDNYKDEYYGIYYYDLTSGEGTGSFAHFGNFNMYLNENADTASLSDVHNTTIHINDGKGNYAIGTCSVNFKKLIALGGGSFNGTYTIIDGSAMTCNGTVFTNLPALTITGSMNPATKNVSFRIQGKLYF